MEVCRTNRGVPGRAEVLLRSRQWETKNIQYDDYQIEFAYFEPGAPTSSVFEVPEECVDGKAIDVDGPPSVSMNMRSIIPRVQSGIEQTEL